MRKTTAVLVIALGVGLAIPASAGWNTKSLGNLSVNVEYMGYSGRNSAGDPIYHIGDLLRYKITFINNGKRPYKNFPIEATLYWAGAVTCQRYWYDNEVVSYGPLSPLPGDSRSGMTPVHISSEGIGTMEGSYVVVPDVCPNLGEIRLDTGRGGGKESLVVPMRFEIRN